MFNTLNIAENFQAKNEEFIEIKTLDKIDSSLSPVFYKQIPPQYLLEFQKNIPSLIIGAFEKTDLIGFAKLTPSSDQFFKHIGKIRIYVSKDYCNLGIGSQLSKKMELLGISMGIIKFETQISTNDLPGMIFCKKNGYSIEGIRTKACFIDGEYRDEFYISKVLN